MAETRDASPNTEPSGITIDALPRVDLVLDTNVVVEMVSAELITRGDRLGSVEAIRESAEFRSWQLRTKYSLVLAWRCHVGRITTLGLWDEPLEILRRNAHPEAKSPATILTQVIAHLVLDRVLGGWRHQALRDDEVELRGTAADQYLLRLAKGYGVALITNEGLGAGQISEKRNLRGRSRAEGVHACSPKEYLNELRADVGGCGLAFCDAFDVVAGDVLRGEENVEPSGAGLEDALRWLSGFYRFVLLDQVDEGEDFKPPSVAWEAAQPAIATDESGNSSAT